jgi:DNA relaxase NicK
MRFDYYRASLERGTDPDQVIGFLASQQALGEIVEDRPVMGYERRTSVLDADGDTFVSVLHGGSNGVLVQASGDVTPSAVAAIRSAWPVHAVTRADVCVDVIEDERGLFDRLEPTLTRIVREHGRVKAKCIRPVIDRDQGATYMIGSRASETYFRAYEKPEQLMAEGLAHKSMRVFFDRWVRCELEAKPQKDNRHTAATFEPSEYFGLSRMGRSIASELLAQVVEKTSSLDFKQLTTRARRRRALVKQYGATLLEWKEEAGSCAELGLALVDLIRQLEAEKSRCR